MQQETKFSKGTFTFYNDIILEFFDPLPPSLYSVFIEAYLFIYWSLFTYVDIWTPPSFIPSVYVCCEWPLIQKILHYVFSKTFGWNHTVSKAFIVHKESLKDIFMGFLKNFFWNIIDHPQTTSIFLLFRNFWNGKRAPKDKEYFRKPPRWKFWGKFQLTHFFLSHNLLYFNEKPYLHLLYQIQM